MIWQASGYYSWYWEFRVDSVLVATPRLVVKSQNSWMVPRELLWLTVAYIGLLQCHIAHGKVFLQAFLVVNPKATLCCSLRQFSASSYYLRQPAATFILVFCHVYNIPWPKANKQVKLTNPPKTLKNKNKKHQNYFNYFFSNIRGIPTNYCRVESFLLEHSPDILSFFISEGF